MSIQDHYCRACGHAAPGVEAPPIAPSPTIRKGPVQTAPGGITGTVSDPDIQGDTEAVKCYQLAVEQGDAEAQSNLGLMYDEGRGVPQDNAEAMKWYRLAANQGLAEAQYNLGLMYYTGQGVAQDYAEAVKWYQLAAEQRDVSAQSALGLMYAEGLGVPQDYAEAVKWYRLAAEQGYASAQFNLGLMYNDGEGVPQDYAEAVKWYRLAADQGDASAQYNLALMYKKGEGGPQDYVQAANSPNQQSAPPAEPHYKGVGGWLLLSCLLLTVVTPLGTLRNTAAFVDGFSEYSKLFAPFPGVLFLIVIDNSVSWGLVGFSIYAGVGLWRIRPGAVQTVKRFLLCALAYQPVSVFLPYMVGLPSALTAPMLDQGVKEALISLSTFGIWYLYFNKSRRVRATYE